MKRIINSKIITIFIFVAILIIISVSSASASFDVGIYVTDDNHNPLESTQVTVENDNYHGNKLTNTKGACIFELDPGQYEITLEHEDYDTINKKVQVSQSTTYAYDLEPESDDVKPFSYWIPLIFIIMFGIALIIILVNLGSKGKKKKKRGKLTVFFVITIILITIVSNAGCLEEVGTARGDYDSNPLYSGEGKWFFTTLDFEIYVKSFNSRSGTPELPDPKPENEATQQLYSEYTIRITPVDPGQVRDNYRGGSDGNDDGTPDGIQVTEDYAMGVDGILQSIPESCNGQGYDGKLYNGIVRDPKKLDLADDILPQTERRAGVRASSDDDRGLIENIFSGTMDRPFMRMFYNFQDDFLEEAIYCAVPITVHVTAKGKFTGREIFSTDLVVPFFVHLPPPGQDREITDQVSLDIFTPLNFLGGGIIKIEAQGSEMNGYAWMNVKTQSSILENIYNDWKKAVEDYKVAMELMVIGAVVGLFCPLAGLIMFVVAAFLLWGTYDDPLNGIDKFAFIPGIGWHFDKGFLKGLEEWAYNVMPGVTEPESDADV